MPEVTVKLWVGVLSMEMEEKIFFQDEAVATYDLVGAGSDETALPLGKALVRVVDEHFAFQAVESGGGGPGIFRRMEAVESGLTCWRGGGPRGSAESSERSSVKSSSRAWAEAAVAWAGPRNSRCPRSQTRERCITGDGWRE